MNNKEVEARLIQTFQKQVNEAYKNYDLKKVLKVTEDLMNNASEIDSPKAKGLAYKSFGSVAAQSGNLIDAFKNFNLALPYENYLELDSRAMIYSSIGNIHQIFEEYDKMFENFKIALSLVSQTNDTSQYAFILLNIANGYTEYGDFETAENYYKQVLDTAQKKELKDFEAKVLQNLGVLQYRKNNYDLALDLYKKALARRDEKDKILICFNEICIADVYRRTGHYSKAIKIYETHIPLMKKIGRTDQQINLTAFSMECALENGDFEKAKSYYMQLSSLENEIQAIQQVKMIVFWKKKYCEKLQDYKMAFKLSEEFNSIMEKLFQEKTKKMTARNKMTIQLKIEKDKIVQAENENSILKEKNNELEKTIIKLNEAHKSILKLEKKNAVLATIVTANHELNQPLMILSGSFELLLYSLKEYDFDKKQKKYIEDINFSVNKIATTLNQYIVSNTMEFTDYLKDTPMVKIVKEKHLKGEKHDKN